MTLWGSLQSPKFKLSVSIIIMYIGFVLHFDIHESLISKSNSKGLSFSYPSSMTIACSIFNLISSGVIVLYQKLKFPSAILPYSMIAIPQQFSASFTNRAIKYIDYPTISLIKCAKPIVVMLISIFALRSEVSNKRIIVVILITFGLLTFSYSQNFGASSADGYILSFLGLFFDAIYVPIVDKLKVRSGGPFMTMFLSSFWSIIITLLYGLREILDSLSFLSKNVEYIPKIIAFGLTGSVAQLALYQAIGQSDGIVVSIATTTRKFFTILLSSIKYHHSFNIRQWIGILIVFASLGIDSLWKEDKMKGKLA